MLERACGPRNGVPNTTRALTESKRRGVRSCKLTRASVASNPPIRVATRAISLPGVLPGERLDAGGKPPAQMADRLTPVERGIFDNRPELVHQGQGHTVINEGDYTAGLDLDGASSASGYAHRKGERFDGRFQSPTGCRPSVSQLSFNPTKSSHKDQVHTDRSRRPPAFPTVV